ncbi:hypothetical protein ONZ52_09285 [Marinomonas sp. KJ51-3]|uniref:Uncharacterized protein n=1 Tax=Marinomonas rhodophyticola TaxID=2992803 RepID=A0ABT3KG50_9GAMM|nr:HD domain-containing phosphohydrolase [Marinomonas sp. KJ51-3]MCW4629146.1 hypothetical protein [Marinomonas sp. KJ51-3]
MPEHIMDKDSKLECLYNRIHEIRTRFEVLWRDAEIAYLHAVHMEKQNPEAALKVWQERQTALQEQFAFIAKANLGSEFMSEADQQKVRDIGTQTWTRHFSDRLGLSPAEETMRTTQTQTVDLNHEERAQQGITENLLSDKPEHIIPRFKEMTFDPLLGIKMAVPEHQYNQGEIYNLTIPKGTLTKEDRFKINEHIISTITMLESLPFPPEAQSSPSLRFHSPRKNGRPRLPTQTQRRTTEYSRQSTDDRRCIRSTHSVRSPLQNRQPHQCYHRYHVQNVPRRSP